jgi:histone-lysine N-methyltransferase SETMAR
MVEKDSEAQEYDTARPHTSPATMEAIDKLDLTLTPHPPYSPDLAPCDFHTVPKMKEDLCGYLYDSNEEVERIVRTWTKKQSVEFFCDSFQKLVLCWKKCVANGGDYVEM